MENISRISATKSRSQVSLPYPSFQYIFADFETVFPGILDYHGDNTIAVSLWAQDSAGASLTVDWTVLGVVESAFDPGFEAEYLRPGWTDNRSDYY